MTDVPDWIARQTQLTRLATRRLFFIGGAPRSGTTWLQRLLDTHPDISCRGEGLFGRHLAMPIDAMYDTRREAVAEKNASVLAGQTGYDLPDAGDADMLLGTAILLALARQVATKGDCRAIGEKTPENVFLFPRLRRLFPQARFIGIARDPRDVLASAWRFFHDRDGNADPGARSKFVIDALPSIGQGVHAMLTLQAASPSSATVVTYEALHAAPHDTLARLFAFLGIAADDATIDTCVGANAFGTASGGQAPGIPANGAFFRRGDVGGWRDTLTPAMDADIRDSLGWMFPIFGWTP